MKTNKNKTWYRVDEAAGILHCSQRTCYRLIYEGQLLAFRLRSSLRISGESIDLYIQSQVLEFQEKEGIEYTLSVPSSPGSPPADRKIMKDSHGKVK